MDLSPRGSFSGTRISSFGTAFQLLFVMFLALPAFSQGNAGRILGTITDQTSGSIAGAVVTIVDVQRGATRPLTTDQSGEYNAPNLLPGTYKVRVEAKGFKLTERDNLILEVNQELRVDLALQPGEVTETITVSEALPMVETTNAELGGSLQSAVIDNLPLNGRNFENLLQLRPGVMIYPGGSGWAQSANGQRPHDNMYLVNGVVANDPWMGQSVMNAVMASGDAGTILPVDAIDEFKTEENPRAEYGWKPGAIVNVGIKSGTNRLHGTAYAYGRDTALDARNYFNPPYLNPSTQQPVALEQFGGTLGGPIKKDKLFYFVNYESQRYSIGNPALHNVPITNAGGGAKNSLIDACTAAKTAGALTALSASLAGLNGPGPSACTPLSGQPSGGFLGLFPVSATKAYFTDLSNNNGINGGLGKVNYYASDKHSFEGMYFLSQGDDLAVDAVASQVANAWLSIEHARSQAASGSWTWTPNSAWVNEVRFGYAHYYQLLETQDHNESASSYVFNGHTYVMPTGITNPLYGGFPGITISGFQNGIGGGWPKIIGPDGVLTLLDHISYLRGKHAFMFGVEVLSNGSIEDETSNAKGPVRFAASGLIPALQNFFEGNLQRANIFLGDPVRTLSSQGYAAFLQDDWRLKSRLILNLGVRYEINTVVKDKNNQLANFDPTQGLVQGTPYQGDHNNFSPRMGIAWDVAGNSKTVVRAAGGILYEQMSFDVLNGEGNLLGLRTMPTGLPRYNAGSNTPLPLAGNIQLQALAFTTGSNALSTISTAWQHFNPAKPIGAGNPALYSNVLQPACGDGITQPRGFVDPPAPCEIFGVDPNLRTPYVSNWNLDIQRAITNNVTLDVGYVGNHGTKLLGKLDHNQPQTVGGFSPGWGNPAVAGTPANLCMASASAATPYDNCSPDGAAEQAALPFTAPCAASVGVGPNRTGGPFNPGNRCLSYLSYITIVNNAYSSNYNGLQATLTASNYHGLSFTSGYTFSHALGEGSDQGTSGNLPGPTNSYGNVRQQLYASTDFDIRQRFTFSVNYALPGKKGFAQLLEGWAINSVVLIQSGAPWGLSDGTDDFSGTDEIGSGGGIRGEQWDFFGNPSDFTPIHGWTDTNGGALSGGSGGLPYFRGGNIASAPTTNALCNAKAAAMGPLALASLFNLGCYAVNNSVLIPPAYGSYGVTPQNLWRDGGFRNWDFSVTKTFSFRERLNAAFRAEFFNVLNRPDFSNPSGGPGGGVGDPSGGPPFGFSGQTPDTYSSNPQLGSGGARAIQLGLKLSF